MTHPAVERSGELWKSGFICAESVLLALAESQGIQSPLLPRIATGFGSGISRTGGQCGAVSGAILGIGLATGRDRPTENKDPMYDLVRQFLTQFQERFGSTNCRVLVGCDLGTPAGQAYYKENHLVERCLQYTQGATEIALAVLAERAKAG